MLAILRLIVVLALVHHCTAGVTGQRETSLIYAENGDSTVQGPYQRKLETRLDRLGIFEIFFVTVYENSSSSVSLERLTTKQEFKLRVDQIIQFYDTGAPGYNGEAVVSSINDNSLSWNSFAGGALNAANPTFSHTSTNGVITVHGHIDFGVNTAYPDVLNPATCRLDIAFPGKLQGTKLALQSEYMTLTKFQVPTIPERFEALSGDLMEFTMAAFTSPAANPVNVNGAPVTVTRTGMVEVGEENPYQKDYRGWITIDYVGTDPILDFSLLEAGSHPDIVPYCNGIMPNGDNRKDQNWCLTGVVTPTSPAATSAPEDPTTSDAPEEPTSDAPAESTTSEEPTSDAPEEPTTAEPTPTSEPCDELCTLQQQVINLQDLVAQLEAELATCTCP